MKWQTASANTTIKLCKQQTQKPFYYHFTHRVTIFHRLHSIKMYVCVFERKALREYFSIFLPLTVICRCDNSVLYITLSRNIMKLDEKFLLPAFKGNEILARNRYYDGGHTF